MRKWDRWDNKTQKQDAEKYCDKNCIDITKEGIKIVVQDYLRANNGHDKAKSIEEKLPKSIAKRMRREWKKFINSRFKSPTNSFWVVLNELIKSAEKREAPKSKSNIVINPMEILIVSGKIPHYIKVRDMYPTEHEICINVIGKNQYDERDYEYVFSFKDIDEFWVEYDKHSGVQREMNNRLMQWKIAAQNAADAQKQKEFAKIYKEEKRKIHIPEKMKEKLERSKDNE